MSRPWIVKTPMGAVWSMRFKSAQAAWRRIVRPAKHASESEEAAKDRMQRAGWVVYSEQEKDE